MPKARRPRLFRRPHIILGSLAAVMSLLLGGLQLADRFGSTEKVSASSDDTAVEPTKLEEPASSESIADQPDTSRPASPPDAENPQPAIIPAPSRAGWPVIITVAVDELKPDKTPWDTGTTLLDASTAPDVILQIVYDDGTSDLLLGPNYQEDWLIHPWGGAARDLSNYPCIDKYACLITGELIKQASFDINILEWDPAMRPNQSTAERIGTLHCTLNTVCRGAGVELTFKPI